MTKMIENWVVICKQENEYWVYTVWRMYQIVSWFIIDDRWNYTNFWNVRKRFKIYVNKN